MLEFPVPTLIDPEHRDRDDQAAGSSGMGSDIAPEQAKTLAQEAYVFGLPLVYIQTQVDVLTHVSRPQGGRAPINQFAHYRAFPTRRTRRSSASTSTRCTRSPSWTFAEPWSCPCRRWATGSGSCSSSTAGTTSPRAGLAHGRWHGRRLRDRRTRLARALSPRGHRAANADQHRDPRRPDLHPGPDDYAAVHALQDRSSWYRCRPGARTTCPRRGPTQTGRRRSPVGAQVTGPAAEAFFTG